MVPGPLIYEGSLAPEFTILTDDILHCLSKGQQPQFCRSARLKPKGTSNSYIIISTPEHRNEEKFTQFIICDTEGQELYTNVTYEHRCKIPK